MAKLASCGDNIKIFGVPSYNTNDVFVYEPFKGSSKIKTISWSKDGQFIATVPQPKGCIEIASVNDNGIKKLSSIRNFDCPTVACFQNTCKRYLAMGSSKGSIAVYDLKSKKFQKYFESVKSPLTHLVFNSNDSYLAAGCSNGEINLYSTIKNIKSSVLSVNQSPCLSALKFHPTHKPFLAGGDDYGTIAVWDINIKKPKMFLKFVHASHCSDIAFSPVNTNLVTSVGYDKTFNCYDLNSNVKITSKKMDQALCTIDILNSGNFVALGSKFGLIYIIDLRYQEKIFTTIEAHNSEVIKVIYKVNTSDNTSNSHISAVPSPAKSTSDLDTSQITSTSLNDSFLFGNKQHRLSSTETDNEEIFKNVSNNSNSSFLEAMGISEPKYDEDNDNTGEVFNESNISAHNRSKLTESLKSFEIENNEIIPVQNTSSATISSIDDEDDGSPAKDPSDVTTINPTNIKLDNSEILSALNKINSTVNVHIAEVLENVRGSNLKLDDVLEKMRLEFIYLRMSMFKQFVKQDYKFEMMHKEMLEEIYKLREENELLKTQMKNSRNCF